MNVRNLVMVSLEPWDAIWRRNQFICQELVQRNPGFKILFVEPARDVSNTLRSGRWQQLKGVRLRETTHGSNIFCLRPLKWLPNAVPWFRRFNEWHLNRQIMAQLKHLKLEQDVVLWINAHQAGHLHRSLPRKVLVYDVTDDWTEFGSATERQLTQKQDALLCRVADGIIVCSDRLLAQKSSSTAAKVVLIPNGVHAEHYEGVLNPEGALPEDSAEWPKPVLGYVGTIHDQRLDLDLLESLANQLKQGRVVLVGPNHLNPNQMKKLSSLGNVIFTGAVPYQNVPLYMKHFNVCIVPHLVSQFTESLNPIKLWEYLAAGKPIIATNVAGFRDFPEHVCIANNAEDFFKASINAINEPVEKGYSRRQEALRHSWTSRVAAVETFLNDLTSPPARSSADLGVFQDAHIAAS